MVDESQLARMRLMLEAARAEFQLLHNETERLTKEEYALHLIQQRYVSKRNAMQSTLNGLYQIVAELEKEKAAQEQANEGG